MVCKNNVQCLAADLVFYVHMRSGGVAVHTHKFHESCAVALPNHFLHVMM